MASLSGDLVAQGFTQQYGKQLDQKAAQAQIREKQKAALEQILFREKVRRESDEINRQAKLETEKPSSRVDSIDKKTKQRLFQQQLISAAGGARNLSDNFGREQARGLQRVEGTVDTSPLNFNQVAQRPDIPRRINIRQQPQISESLRSRFDNIQTRLSAVVDEY